MKSRNNTSGWLLTLMSALFMLTAFTACARDGDTARWGGASLDPDDLYFDANGGTQTVKVDKGEFKHFGVIDDRDYEWLSFENTSNGIIVTALPNVEPEKRYEYVKVRFWNQDEKSNADNDKDNDSGEIQFEGVEQKEHLTLIVNQEGAGEFPDEGKVRSAHMSACVTYGRFSSFLTGREFDDEEGGGIWFNQTEFVYSYTDSGFDFHAELKIPESKNKRTGTLSFDLENYNNLVEGVSKLTNVKFTLSSPTVDGHYSIKMTDIPIVEIKKTSSVTIHAKGGVADGVKFSDFTYTSSEKELIGAYYDSEYNRVDLSIELINLLSWGE